MELFIPFLLTAPFLHNLIDGQMLQSCTVRENLAVTCLAHARGTRDNYVGFALRHEFEGVDRWDMTLTEDLSQLEVDHQYPNR